MAVLTDQNFELMSPGFIAKQEMVKNDCNEKMRQMKDYSVRIARYLNDPRDFIQQSYLEEVKAYIKTLETQDIRILCAKYPIANSYSLLLSNLKWGLKDAETKKKLEQSANAAPTAQSANAAPKGGRRRRTKRSKKSTRRTRRQKK